MSFLLSLVAEHVLSGCGAWAELPHSATQISVCEIFLEQGSNPCLLHWQTNF